MLQIVQINTNLIVYHSSHQIDLGKNRRMFATDSNIPESFKNYWNETGIAQSARG